MGNTFSDDTLGTVWCIKSSLHGADGENFMKLLKEQKSCSTHSNAPALGHVSVVWAICKESIAKKIVLLFLLIGVCGGTPWKSCMSNCLWETKFTTPIVCWDCTSSCTSTSSLDNNNCNQRRGLEESPRSISSFSSSSHGSSDKHQLDCIRAAQSHQEEGGHHYGCLCFWELSDTAFGNFLSMWLPVCLHLSLPFWNSFGGSFCSSAVVVLASGCISCCYC